jgi:hypothetical protein
MASSKNLDVELLRRTTELGGLNLPADRAEALLPLAKALLKSCEKLEALDLSAKGGAGALSPWGGLAWSGK